ncbi:MAG: hypothetical protein IJL92_04505 [Thermoguttaceae bacterium]|nr:hypothetical protein [Thermoguttaceae bacterium]
MNNKNEAKLLLNVMQTYVAFIIEQLDDGDVSDEQLEAVKYAREIIAKTLLLLNEKKESKNKIGFKNNGTTANGSGKDAV